MENGLVDRVGSTERVTLKYIHERVYNRQLAGSCHTAQPAEPAAL